MRRDRGRIAGKGVCSREHDRRQMREGGEVEGFAGRARPEGTGVLLLGTGGVCCGYQGNLSPWRDANEEHRWGRVFAL